MSTEQIATIGVLIGALAPFLTALVQQGTWSPTVRRWVAIGVSVVLGVGTVIGSGDFDTANWIVTLATVIGAAQVVYAGFNKITDRVEYLTTPPRRRKGYVRAA